MKIYRWAVSDLWLLFLPEPSEYFQIMVHINIVRMKSGSDHFEGGDDY